MAGCFKQKSHFDIKKPNGTELANEGMYRAIDV